VKKKVYFQIISDPEKQVSKYFEVLSIIGQNKSGLALVGKYRKLNRKINATTVFRQYKAVIR
jgi:hypothetical protein